MDIELGEVEWVDKEDSILKANIACQIPVTFHGAFTGMTKKTASVGGIRAGLRKGKEKAMAKEEKGMGAETAAELAVPVYETIEHWYNVHGTGPAVHAGTFVPEGLEAGETGNGTGIPGRRHRI